MSNVLSRFFSGHSVVFEIFEWTDGHDTDRLILSNKLTAILRCTTARAPRNEFHHITCNTCTQVKAALCVSLMHCMFVV